MFCEKGGGKIDTRKRITIRLPQDVYRDILDNLGNAASSTFNSFMTNAARFYLGYIKARETEDYLSKTLLSIISARQERSDKATVSVLYALAVELNILQRILVSHFDIPDEVYAELRRKARAEVAVSRKGAQIESVQAQMFGGDPGWQSSSQNGAKCFIFMYFLLPHWVPATWRRRAQTSIRAELPSGKVPTTRVLRRISRFSRSITLLVRIRVQCS